MALSLGKKKKEVAETDWSEDALLDDDAPAPVAVEPTATTPFDAAPKKKPLPKIALAALPVLLLGGGAAAYFMMSGAPEEEEPAPKIGLRKPKPPMPDKPNATNPKLAPAKPETPQKPVVAGKPIKPEPRGFKPDDNKTLVFQSPGPGAPHVVPGPMVPTPVQPPNGLAGTPGRYGSRNVEIVAVGGGGVPISEGLQTQLDALWQQGAAAKHSGDNAAARQAWGQILQLSPAHPGIQDAINKLPK